MAIKERITVEFMGKFGPNVGGTWYNISPKSGLKVDQFEKGKTYDVLLWISKSGKKYINQIVGEEQLVELGNGVQTMAVVNNETLRIEPHVIEGSRINSVAQVQPSTGTTAKPGDDKIISILKGGTPDHREKKEVDWDKKTAQIQAQGCIQAAVQSPGLQLLLITDYDGYWKNVERLAKDMLKFVQDNS